jgi:hypothetical protein
MNISSPWERTLIVGRGAHIVHTRQVMFEFFGSF